MRNLLVIALLTLGGLAEAQTYFYINAIAVNPLAPTPADNVSIALSGDLASTGAYIVSASATVNNGQVVISIVADDAGGFAVLVPHIETIDLGPLPVGPYTITFDPVNVADLAQPEQHHFTVTQGGTSCDSLNVVGPYWHPFTDTALVVRSEHSLLPDTLWNPAFTLLDESGDTSANEPFPYPYLTRFNPRWHMLVPQDAGAFNGNIANGALVFSSSDYGDFTCVRFGPFDLCPPGSCQPIQPVIQNLGGGITENTFAWNIVDGNGAVVATGTFTLTTEQQADTGYACLPPGAYTLVVALVDAPSAGQPWCGLVADGISGPMAPLSWTDPLVLPFVFHPVCAGIALALPEAPPTALQAWSDGSLLHVLRTDQRPLGEVTVMDATGQLLARATGRSNALAIPLMRTAPRLLVVSTAAGTVRLCVLPD
ncbi:MAG: hypothetical protein U0U25_10120 [Flavobacteriales bacterium]